MAATNPPVGRVVLLSKFDETVDLHGRRFDLQCNQFPGNIHPKGYKSLEKFEKELFPVFQYNIEGIKLRKTIAAIKGENTTIILYEVLSAISSFVLELQPFIAARYYHNLTEVNDAIRKDSKFKNGLLKAQPYDGFEKLYIHVPNSMFEHHPEWYFNFEYPMERQRGLDYTEDLFTYGHFAVNLNLGDQFGVIISTQNPTRKNAFELFENEKQRRLELFNKLTIQDDISKRLVMAADQFIVQKGENLKTVIAGYHWFTDWGRDAMISLPGLTLVTGRHDEAREILQTFAKYIDQGMLPNDFPDIEDEPEYNSVDTSLWFFIAIYKYLHYTKDEKFIQQEMMPVLKEIIDWHIKGTRFNIHLDDDGLLYAGEPGYKLTWMEAKVDDKIISPRHGKAIEINALWYNALMIYSELLNKFETSKIANEFERRGENVKRKFLEVFWYDNEGYFYDYIDGETKDSSLRPNQIFALSLPYPLVSGERAKQVFKVILQNLFTPYGLRTLSPEDLNYKGHYFGNQAQRDNAYHQGTAWTWLLGPFITAMVRFYGEYGRERAKQIIMNFVRHFEVAGIGTVSEIFDGDKPYAPRGGIAKAWSVAEILRTYIEDIVGKQK